MAQVRRSRHPAARDAERFKCSRCGALPGEQCQSRTGRPCLWPHTARYRTAEQAVTARRHG